jgi:cell division protein FtsB
MRHSKKYLTRYRFKNRHKNRYTLLIAILIFGGFLLFFFAPQGAAKLIYQNYKIKARKAKIEELKLKALLLEDKTVKLQDSRYLRKFLQDYYKFVPKESIVR